MKLFITGTPFAIDLEGGVTWNVNGYLSEGNWKANPEGTVIDATGFGYCGGTTPATPPPAYAYVSGEAHPDWSCRWMSFKDRVVRECT